jgi:hypothetical protein
MEPKCDWRLSARAKRLNEVRVYPLKRIPITGVTPPLPVNEQIMRVYEFMLTDTKNEQSEGNNQK